MFLLYMCVYKYIYTYILIDIVCVRGECTYLHICIYIYEYMRTYMHIGMIMYNIYIYTCVHLCIPLSVRVCLCLANLGLATCLAAVHMQKNTRIGTETAN